MTERREPPAYDGRPAEQPRDPSRRQFFRTFGQQTVSSAGQVLRVADQLRRGSTGAATELLGIGVRDPRSSAARVERRLAATASPAEAGELANQGIAADEQSQTATFRSPYLLTDDALVLLDQRQPLELGATLSCVSASMVTAAIRQGIAGGGPVLAQIAAYGLVVAAVHGPEQPRRTREASFQAAVNMLRAARPSVRAIDRAIERVLARWEALPDEAAQPERIDALRDEADQIAAQAALDHARLGRLGAEVLPQPEDRPMAVLAHGDMGPLAGGIVGTGFAVIQAIASADRDVHVWLTEAAPSLEGARVAAPQLAQADIAHTVIPDSAIGWLFAERPPDAVLLRADWVCANGDTAALLGSLGIARLAQAARVPVYACAPGAVLDLGTLDGSAIPRSRVQPDLDVVPGADITAFITDGSVESSPPTGTG